MYVKWNGRKSTDAGIVLAACLTIIAIMVGLALLGGAIFTFLWNLVVPAIGGPSIDVWPTGVAAVFLLQVIGSLLRR